MSVVPIRTARIARALNEPVPSSLRAATDTTRDPISADRPEARTSVTSFEERAKQIEAVSTELTERFERYNSPKDRQAISDASREANREVIRQRVGVAIFFAVPVLIAIWLSVGHS